MSTSSIGQDIPFRISFFFRFCRFKLEASPLPTWVTHVIRTLQFVIFVKQLNRNNTWPRPSPRPVEPFVSISRFDNNLFWIYEFPFLRRHVWFFQFKLFCGINRPAPTCHWTIEFSHNLCVAIRSITTTEGGNNSIIINWKKKLNQLKSIEEM